MTTLTDPVTTAASAPVGRATDPRWPAILTAVAGGIFLDGAVITAAYRGSSPAPEDSLAFPWQGSTAVATSLVWGLAQGLMVVGLVAFARSDAPTGRIGKIGSLLAITGGVGYTVAHLVSVAAYDTTTDDPSAIVAMTLFGIGTVCLAVGLILAGVASLRCTTKSPWARRAPLALGVWMVLMMPLQFTPALAVAVGIYAVLVIVFGAALLDRRSGAPR